MKCEARIAPRLHAARGVAEPRAAHAYAGDKAHAAIHDERFAVVATEPAERAIEARRVVVAHLTASLHEWLPKAARRAERADPIEQHAHFHPATCALGEGVAESLTDFIRTQDVVFKIHRRARRADRLVPCVVIRRRIQQQLHAIPAHERSARRAGKGAFSDGAHPADVLASVVQMLGSGIHGGTLRRARRIAPWNTSRYNGPHYGSGNQTQRT